MKNFKIPHKQIFIILFILFLILIIIAGIKYKTPKANEKHYQSEIEKYELRNKNGIYLACLFQSNSSKYQSERINALNITSGHSENIFQFLRFFIFIVEKDKLIRTMALRQWLWHAQQASSLPNKEELLKRTKNIISSLPHNDMADRLDEIKNNYDGINIYGKTFIGRVEFNESTLLIGNHIVEKYFFLKGSPGNLIFLSNDDDLIIRNIDAFISEQSGHKYNNDIITDAIKIIKNSLKNK